MEHSKVRIICDSPLLTLYLYILIHARRRQDSRRTIDLLVTNPRITEWPRPGTVSLRFYLCTQCSNLMKGKVCGDFCEFTLDKGHFITGENNGTRQGISKETQRYPDAGA